MYIFLSCEIKRYLENSRRLVSTILRRFENKRDVRFSVKGIVRRFAKLKISHWLGVMQNESIKTVRVDILYESINVQWRVKLKVHHPVDKFGNRLERGENVTDYAGKSEKNVKFANLKF